MEKLTTEQIDAKVKELSEKLKCKVKSIVFEVEGEQIVGYAQAPQYQVILFCQNAMANGKNDDALEAVLRDCLLVADSDPRMNSEERGNAMIKATTALSCVEMLTPYLEALKKK
jgi:tellurite resistance protein